MHREKLDSALLSAEKSENNIGALIISIRFGGMLYYNGNKEPPKIVLDWIGLDWMRTVVPSVRRVPKFVH